MKYLNYTLGLFTLIVLFMLSGCQKEIDETITSDDDEQISANSTAAKLLVNLATNDGSLDNIIDNASCLNVQLPVTVIVNGEEVVVESEEDFEVIEAIFEEFEDDEDTLEIQFPITIILSDFSEVVINNEDELEEFIEECDGDNIEDDDIECIDIQYPITLQTFDANNNLLNTVTITNDETLFEFFDNLDDNVVVRVEFPVSVILSDGSTVQINTLGELITIIQEAEDDCDEDDDNDFNDDDGTDIDTQALSDILIGSTFEIDELERNDEDLDEFEGFLLQFNQDGILQITDNEGAVKNGTWAINEDENGRRLMIDAGDCPELSLNWRIHKIEIDREDDDDDGDDDDDELDEIEVELRLGGDNSLELTRTQDPVFEEIVCFDDTNEFTICDEDDNPNDGRTALELDEFCFQDVTFFLTEADAQENVNEIGSPYTNTSNPQTLFARYEYRDEVDIKDFTVTVEQCDTEAAISLVKTAIYSDANANSTADIGDHIDYTFSVTNEGDVALENVILTDPLLGGDISGPVSGDDNNIGVLDIDEIWIYTATYEVTEADFDNGEVVNQATITAQDSNGNSVTDLSDDDSTQEDDPTISSLEQNPQIALVKTGDFQDENGNSIAEEGETITYTFTVTNQGNVSLQNIILEDVNLGGVVSGPFSGDNNNDGVLEIDEAWVYTATYSITQGDIDAGVVRNQASVEAEAPDGDTVFDDSDNDSPFENDPTITQLPSNRGSVSGKLFHDVNGNGVQDPGEDNLSGIQVNITPETESPFTVFSNDNGKFFLTLEAGEVTIDIDDTTLPDGAILTSGTDPTTITVNAGQNILLDDNGYTF